MTLTAIPLDVINALASLGALALSAATAIAGIVQLKHVRGGYELAAVFAIQRDFRGTDIQAALRYVQHELPYRMQDSDYRAELSTLGYIDPRSHPEMMLCNWFDRTGALVRAGFLKEELLLDTFGRLICHFWLLLAPAIAVMRRRRGTGQYVEFEYLAYRSELHAHQRKMRGHNAVGEPAVDDPWLAHDRPTADAPQPERI